MKSSVTWRSNNLPEANRGQTAVPPEATTTATIDAQEHQNLAMWPDH